MITTRRNRNLIQAFFAFVELVYHATVRHVRKSSGSASLGLVMEIFSSLMFVAMFWAMFTFLGLKAFAIRGNFILFLVTGVFLYLTHIKAISAVMGAGGATSPIMKHAPMTVPIAILSAAFAGLYLQILAFLIILVFIHMAYGLEIYYWQGLFVPFLLTWTSGVGIGLILMSLKPFIPKLVGIIATVYKRANMVASGKMTTANVLGMTGAMWFSWNPLFHTIDQARGAAFVNYTPHWTNLAYPFWFSVVTIIVGLLAERWLAKNASLSWDAR